jgi:hypothetical protein
MKPVQEVERVAGLLGDDLQARCHMSLQMNASAAVR